MILIFFQKFAELKISHENPAEFEFSYSNFLQFGQIKARLREMFFRPGELQM